MALRRPPPHGSAITSTSGECLSRRESLHPGDRAVLPPPQPHRARAYRVRAVGPQTPGGSKLRHARAAGAPRSPSGAAVGGRRGRCSWTVAPPRRQRSLRWPPSSPCIAGGAAGGAAVETTGCSVIRWATASRSERICATTCWTGGAARWSACCLTLPCRDRWIGWEGQAFPSACIVAQCRCCFLGCRSVTWLRRCWGWRRASSRDWQRLHGYRPVPRRRLFRASTGRAATGRHWQLVGRTEGAGRGAGPGEAAKDAVLPLHPRWREIMLRSPPTAPQRGRRGRHRRRPLCAHVAGHPRQRGAGGGRARPWQRRRRSLSTLLVVLFVYRLAYSPQPRGYALILADLWECCRRLGIDLPQPRPVAASSMCAARSKVGTGVHPRGGPTMPALVDCGRDRASPSTARGLHLPRHSWTRARTPSPASQPAGPAVLVPSAAACRSTTTSTPTATSAAARQHLAALAPRPRSLWTVATTASRCCTRTRARHAGCPVCSATPPARVTGASRTASSPWSRRDGPQPAAAGGAAALPAAWSSTLRGRPPALGTRCWTGALMAVTAGRTVQGDCCRSRASTDGASGGEAGGVRSLHARGLSRLFATECERELAVAAAQPGRPPQRAHRWARWRGSCCSSMPRCCARRSTGCWRTWPAARSGSGRTGLPAPVPPAIQHASQPAD